MDFLASNCLLGKMDKNVSRISYVFSSDLLYINSTVISSSCQLINPKVDEIIDWACGFRCRHVIERRR